MSSGYSQNTMKDGKTETPLPYFDDFDQGYVILRDKTKMEGKISLKNYEKDGRISFESSSGSRYKFDVRSLSSWGLNINIPKSRSPLSYYSWKTMKRRENDGYERGFVLLTSGELKTGKIKIEGRSSESYLAGENYFALETLRFLDDSGNETVHKRDVVKEFGRILPWALSPAECFTFGIEFMGKKKSKAQQGYVILDDGRKIEGMMKLVVKNKMYSINSRNQLVNAARSELVDEIHFERDGKDEKIDINEVFAYGIPGMTINSLTNNMDKTFNIEEMNFHSGTITMKGGQKKEGLIAFFPEAGNYYGVYFATGVDEPVQIIPMKEMEKVEQDISMIEAYDETGGVASGKVNTNINGYIISSDGTKHEGTVKLEGDQGFWCRGIEFTSKGLAVTHYGNGNQRIVYAVIENTLYVQHGDYFMKAEGFNSPLSLYNNPHPDNTPGIVKAAMQVKEALDAPPPPVIPSYTRSQNVTLVPEGHLVALIHNLGNSMTEGIITMLSKKEKTKPQEKLPYKSRKGNDFFILNVHTGEVAKNTTENWEILLEGCMQFLSLDRKAQKQLLNKNDRELLVYLNEQYGLH